MRAKAIDSIGVIVPVFNEAQALYENLSTIYNKVSGFVERFFICVVDDGSSDGTWEEIGRLCETFPEIRGISLSRNFGKESALCAGLNEILKGEKLPDAVLVMDSDLQHPPEMIAPMLEKLREGYDAAECVRESRGKESVFRKLTALLFYRVINRFSGFSMSNSSDFKLLDIEVVKAWGELGEANTFFRGMVEWVGFNKAKLNFQVAQRNGGTSKFSPVTLMRLAMNALTSYSSAPLFITNFLAGVFFIIALVLGAQTLYNKFSGNAVSGFSTVILLLLIIGSAILFCLGIIGTYISRIYDEVKSRPRYIVSKKSGNGQI